MTGDESMVKRVLPRKGKGGGSAFCTEKRTRMTKQKWKERIIKLGEKNLFPTQGDLGGKVFRDLKKNKSPKIPESA